MEELVDWVVQNRVLLVITAAVAAVGTLFIAISGLLAVPRRWMAYGIDGDVGAISFDLTGGAALRQALPLWKHLLSDKWVRVGAILFLMLSFGAAVVPETAFLSLPPLAQSVDSNKKLLVLVHGWNGSGSGTWEKFGELLLSDPELDSTDILILNYPAFSMRRRLNVQETAAWIHETLPSVLSTKKYERAVIIAHSMGGLISRELCMNGKLSDSPLEFGMLIEIGTPHQGAPIGALAAALGISRDLTEDLAPDSPYLRGLHARWNTLSKRPGTLGVTSPRDMVVPMNSATHSCDRSFQYPQWGHSEMVQPTSHGDQRYEYPVRKALEHLAR